MNKQTKRQVNRNKSGFTLFELMVALGVMVLFTVIMTSLMDTATVAYQKSVDSSNADVAVSNTVNKLQLELTEAREVSVVNIEKNKFKSILEGEGYKLSSDSILYKDAWTGAECMIFLDYADGEINNLMVYKYGEIRPLVFTTDGLKIKVGKLTLAENSILIEDIEAFKDGSTYSSVDGVTIKVKSAQIAESGENNEQN